MVLPSTGAILPKQESPRSTCALNAERAFTSLSSWAVIVVIAMASGLLLPALARARSKAAPRRSLSRVWQCGETVGRHASDHAEPCHSNADDQDIPLGQTWFEESPRVLAPDHPVSPQDK